MVWSLLHMTFVAKVLIRFLLACLNSYALNKTPCKYGFIGNVKAFDLGYLRSEVKARPDLKVVQLIAESDAFLACPISKTGVKVIGPDGVHEATKEEIQALVELKNNLTPDRFKFPPKCIHDRLNEEGICRACGEDCRQ
jgi:hypothetical protein